MPEIYSRVSDRYREITIYIFPRLNASEAYRYTSRRYRSPYSHVYSPRSLHRILTPLRLYDSNTRKQEFSYDALYILSANYVCVCVCVDACVRACGRHDYRVRVCPRETHVAGGRPHALHAHAHTLAATHTCARAVTVDQHSHAIPGTWRRIEFVEITFSRDPRSRNANCYPTGIRKLAMVNSSFKQYTRFSSITDKR